MEETILNYFRQDQLRLKALECVRTLDLPDCYIAAGFVRNMVWDKLHNKDHPTPLNDIDVIYFDKKESDPYKFQIYEEKLKSLMPDLNWQVRNQARMHNRNGDPEYLNSLDAMSYWPEQETAVAARKLNTGAIECVSAFGFDSLFGYQVTHNQKRSHKVFQTRVYSKDWLTTWPKLKVVM